MNILHLLSQSHLTGAEVYAVQLCEEQIAQGHHVLQVSNGFFLKTPAHQRQFAVETRSRWQFIKNTFLLRQLIRETKVQVIHCHSRAAAKLAFWSRLGLPVGMVSTIHGRQHSSISKKLFNTYGDILISVCENIQTQLVSEFGYNKRQLTCLPNPISNQLYYFSPKTMSIGQNINRKNLKIAVIGRTTGPKGLRTEQILNMLPAALSSYGAKAEYFLVGGSKTDLNLTTTNAVQEITVDRLTTLDYEPYDIVIGSGRVALESLISGVPVIAFGEACYEGLITPDNLKKSYHSNFGDIHATLVSPNIDMQCLQADLDLFLNYGLTAEHRQQLSKSVAEEFSSRKIARKILRIYESSYFKRNFSKWIPILMYHKVPKEPLVTQHQIFVTEKNFRKHLNFFKSRGFTTLTFNQLAEYKSGRKDFKHFPQKPLILTFDDGYRDNLENASPLLKEFGFNAQLFLLADTTIASNYWDHSRTESASEIISGSDRQLWKDSAFEIGSHGFSHRKMTTMTEFEARLELMQSKKNLEKEFNVPVSVYAFTYGDTNSECSGWAEEEGYDYAVNTDSGGLLLEESPYQIFRVNIFPNETWISLFKKTSSWYRHYYFKKRKK